MEFCLTLKNIFKLAFSVFIILTFLFQGQVSQPTIAQQDSGFQQIDLGSGYKSNEITFATKFYNSTLVSNYTQVVTDWNSNFGNKTDLSSSISSDSIRSSRVITIFGSTTEASTTDVDSIRGALGEGKGLLYLANSDNTSTSAENFFKNLFGAEVVNFTTSEVLGSTYSGTTHYVVATQFNSPTTPVTENITKLVLPHTIGITVNRTAMSESNVSIRDIYPIIYDSTTQKALGLAVEVGTFGRIIILGSTEIFSNEFYLPNGTYTNMAGINNQQFATNVMNWLGRGSGYFHMLGYKVNVGNLQYIKRGFVVNASATLTDENNNTFTNAEVQFQIELTNYIVDYNYMQYQGNNSYFGAISTRNAKPGYYDEIHIQIVKRGYILQTFALTRVYVELEFTGPSLPDWTMIAILGAGIIIFALSGFYLWKEFRKINY